MTAEERSLLRQNNIESLFFMGVKPDADENPTLILPVCSPGGELIYKAGSKVAKNCHL